MAGYSGTPLPRKLGIKPGHRIALLGAPKGFAAGLDLPPDTTVAQSLAGRTPLDVIILFVDRGADLQRRFPTAAKRLSPSGGLWVAWPKKASGVPTDLTEDKVRAIALAAGLVDNKVCAIDETWSGLRLVYRLKDRPRERPPSPGATSKAAGPKPGRSPGRP